MGHALPRSVRRNLGETVPLSALLTDSEGNLATQANLVSIDYLITRSDTDAETDSGTLTISEVIDDSPSAIWEYARAPNFNWDIAPDTAFPEVLPLDTDYYKTLVTATFVGGFVSSQLWRVYIVDVPVASP